MPAPSEIKASQVNDELGISNTSQLLVGNNWVRNVASVSAVATDLKFGNLRWGINVPGGSYTTFGRTLRYGIDNAMEISVSDFELYFPPFSSSSAASQITFRSNGQLTITVTDSGGSYDYNSTWLTSGSASDYTIQFEYGSGDVPSGDVTDTDLALSTTRSWSLTATVGPPGPGSVSLSTAGTLLLKDSGGTLIGRPISLSASAEVSN